MTWNGSTAFHQSSGEGFVKVALALVFGDPPLNHRTDIAEVHIGPLGGKTPGSAESFVPQVGLEKVQSFVAHPQNSIIIKLFNLLNTGSPVLGYRLHPMFSLYFRVAVYNFVPDVLYKIRYDFIARYPTQV